MAHVPVVPIGHAREAVVDEAEFDRENAGHEPLVSKLRARRAEVQSEWGEKYVERVHEKDKLTTRERLERLKDDGSQIFEVGTFVNYGLDFNGLRSPAAGVVPVFQKKSAETKKIDQGFIGFEALQLAPVNRPADAGIDLAMSLVHHFAGQHGRTTQGVQQSQ